MTQTIDPQVDSLYGGDDVRERAEAWARARGLRLSLHRPGCACGLYRRSDTKGWCSPDDYVLLDHARIWNRDGLPVLLLAHSYASHQRIEELAPLYAAQHDLKVTIADPFDDWYGAGAIPIRYELRNPQQRYPKGRAAQVQAGRRDRDGSETRGDPT